MNNCSPEKTGMKFPPQSPTGDTPHSALNFIKEVRHHCCLWFKTNALHLSIGNVLCDKHDTKMVGFLDVEWERNHLLIPLLHRIKRPFIWSSVNSTLHYLQEIFYILRYILHYITCHYPLLNSTLYLIPHLYVLKTVCIALTHRNTWLVCCFCKSKIVE